MKYYVRFLDCMHYTCAATAAYILAQYYVNVSLLISKNGSMFWANQRLTNPKHALHIYACYL